MDRFGAANRWEGQKGLSLSKIGHTYPAMLRLDTVTPHPQKI